MALSSIQRALVTSIFGMVGYFSTEATASGPLSDSMNLLLRAADNNVGNGLSLDDCRQLDELRTDAARPAHDRFKNVADRFWKKLCDDASEDGTAVQVDASPKDVQIWDGQPLCRTGDERILHCSHNSVTGRGLFVYSGSDTTQNSPTLVCAHFSASSRSPFDYLQETGSRCVVTEFDWRYESLRSDVRGVYNWQSSPIGSAALQIPALLTEQCSKVFSDAAYCTPTLIVLREKEETSISTCALRTHDQRFGVGPFLRINSSNSRWHCERKSLLVPNKDERLSVEERSCIPDEFGRIKNDYCRLPYLPVVRRPVRTYLP